MVIKLKKNLWKSQCRLTAAALLIRGHDDNKIDVVDGRSFVSFTCIARGKAHKDDP